MSGMAVNQEILRWARESMNLTLEDVALRMNKDVETIEYWEEGTESPTYVQLETLAYHIYKRPIAVFFFPEPPLEDTQGNRLELCQMSSFKSYRHLLFVCSGGHARCKSSWMNCATPRALPERGFLKIFE